MTVIFGFSYSPIGVFGPVLPHASCARDRVIEWSRRNGTRCGSLQFGAKPGDLLLWPPWARGRTCPLGVPERDFRLHAPDLMPLELALTFPCRSRNTVTPERCSTSSIPSPPSERATSSVPLESCAVADREIRVPRQPSIPSGTGTAHIRRPAAGLIELGVPASAAQSRLGAELAPGQIGWLPG